jgi:hypothetical protein
MRLDDDLAGIEIVQRQLDKAPGGFAVLFEDAIGAERVYRVCDESLLSWNFISPHPTFAHFLAPAFRSIVAICG